MNKKLQKEIDEIDKWNSQRNAFLAGFLFGIIIGAFLFGPIYCVHNLGMH